MLTMVVSVVRGVGRSRNEGIIEICPVYAKQMLNTCVSWVRNAFRYITRVLQTRSTCGGSLTVLSRWIIKEKSEAPWGASYIYTHGARCTQL